MHEIQKVSLVSIWLVELQAYLLKTKDFGGKKIDIQKVWRKEKQCLLIKVFPPPQEIRAFKEGSSKLLGLTREGVYRSNMQGS